MARKTGFVRRSNRMVRETHWIGGTWVRSSHGSASTAVILTTLNAAALALRPFTIVRTRGVLAIESDQVATTEDFTAIYGECVVSDQANAIGVTAVPTPDTDNSSELWHVMQALFGKFHDATTVGFSIQEGFFPFDSRAMRKVEDGQDLIAVAETSAISSGCVISSFSRVLVKLH